MTFSKALKQLKKYRRIKREVWELEYLYFDAYQQIGKTGKTGVDVKWNKYKKDILKNDWIVLSDKEVLEILKIRSDLIFRKNK